MMVAAGAALPKVFLYVSPSMPSFMFLWKEISKSLISSGNHQKFLGPYRIQKEPDLLLDA
jgi:hypothetical protein